MLIPTITGKPTKKDAAAYYKVIYRFLADREQCYGGAQGQNTFSIHGKKMKPLTKARDRLLKAGFDARIIEETLWFCAPDDSEDLDSDIEQENVEYVY